MRDATDDVRKPIDFPHYKLLHFLKGRVTLTDKTGKNHVLTAGDRFYAAEHPQGLELLRLPARDLLHPDATQSMT